MGWPSNVTTGFLCIALLSCGPDHDGRREKDFIGRSRPVSPIGPAAPAEETIIEECTVDLIADLLFRHERDGWTLQTKEAQVTVERLARGGVGLVFLAVGSPIEGKRDLQAGIATTRQLVAATNGRVVMVDDIDKAVRVSHDGSVASMMLVEGADELARADEAALMALKKQGVGIIGLVAGHSNGLAEAAVAPLGERGGLSEEGAAFVQRLRDVGIAVDLTHASERTFYDTVVGEGILALVSHSAARHLREHVRNLTDLQIITLHRSGGLMGLVFNPDFITAGDEGADIDDVVAHFVHVKRLGAVSSCAIGADFNGIVPPRGLEDISTLPALRKKLSSVGFTSSELAGIFGDNALHFLHNVSAKQGAAESTGNELLRPIAMDCELMSGEFSGSPLASCDTALLVDGPTLGPSARQRFRLKEMNRTPVLLEVFGVPGTPWQVEAQDLDGEILLKRGVLLDNSGRGSIPLPGAEKLTRVFLSPTRPSILREAVIWGR